MSVNAIMRVILIVVVKSCICMCWCKVVNFCVFESFYLIDIVHFVVYPSVLSQHFAYAILTDVACKSKKIKKNLIGVKKIT